MKKFTNIFSFVFILFLVSCAENEVTETTENNETNKDFQKKKHTSTCFKNVIEKIVEVFENK